MRNRFPGIVTELNEAEDRKPRGEIAWGLIVIHHTGLGDRKPADIDPPLWKQMFINFTGWLTKKDATYASAHFMIGRDGECVQMVDPDLDQSFHAGQSEFWHPLERKWMPWVNQFGIGIELLGDGNLQDFAYSLAQYDKCARLCAELLKRYSTIQFMVGHEMISPGRKVDPGKAFDWRHFQSMVWAYFNKDSPVVS